MESIWQADIELPEFNALKEDIKTDVLVIGGGITGILCGYMLKSRGVDCVVAEADRICSGTTKNTTAKITYQHGLIYDKMINRFGEDYARLYVESQHKALEKFRQMCKEIPCDYKECRSFVYSLENRYKIENEVKALEKLGCGVIFEEALPLPFKVAGAVGLRHQAQFNPLKFLSQVAKDIKIFENTKISHITPDGAVTDRFKIKAKRIIVATHFPFVNKYGLYFLKMYQHRSYVMALKNAPVFEDVYVDESKTGMSFRSYNGLTFVGGGGHRTGKKGGSWQELESFAQLYYPKSQEVARWAAQDCMTLDDVPYIGRYSKSTPNVYVATGFNKWGMTSAMTAALILSDMVQGINNEYAPIYSPQRSILHPQLAVNALHSAQGLLTPTAPRCPHMGCALKYNPQEHSWDCPCHGSRFTKDGKLIDNPAKKDMRK